MTAAAPVGSTWPDASRTWLGALGVITVGGISLWLAGPVGFLAGGVVAVLWYTLPGPYAVAAGHLLLLAIVPDPVDPGTIAVLEAGFLGVLAAPLSSNEGWPPVLAATGIAGLALGSVAWIGWAAWEPRWGAGIGPVVLVVGALYGLHRYQIVRTDPGEVAD